MPMASMCRMAFPAAGRSFQNSNFRICRLGKKTIHCILLVSVDLKYRCQFC